MLDKPEIKSQVLTPTARKIAELRNEHGNLAAVVLGLERQREDVERNLASAKKRMNSISDVLEGYNLAIQEASEMKALTDGNNS